VGNPDGKNGMKQFLHIHVDSLEGLTKKINWTKKTCELTMGIHKDE
jgi:hypothetical protein